MVLSETVLELSHKTKASKSSLLVNKDFEGANILVLIVSFHEPIERVMVAWSDNL